MGNRLNHPSTTARPAIDGSRFGDAAIADPDQLDLGLPPGRGARRVQRGGMGGTIQAQERALTDGTSAVLRLAAVVITLAGMLAMTASPAWAAGGGSTMPWDEPLTRLVNNLTGTTARLLVTTAVVGAGLLWAFTRNEEGLKKLGQIAFGGAIALGAATMMANLGFAGAGF
jgi:type IV secretion system protein VirB2